MYILSAQRQHDVVQAFSRYREYLHANRNRFPEAAFKLANSAWYFDPREHSCPHDAWLEWFKLEEPAIGSRHEQRELTLTLRLLGAYHDGHIELSYPRVFAYDLGCQEGAGGHGDWIYDEMRIDDMGRLVHEIEWAGGHDTAHWRIIASDVIYRWMPMCAST